MRIQPLEVSHGTEPEGCRGIAEAEHIGRHIQDHGADGRMIERNLGEEEPHDRTQHARQQLHEAALLRQAHHAQPDCPDSHQRQRDHHHRLFGGVESAVGEIRQPPRKSRDYHGDEQKAEPDPIEHGAESRQRAAEDARESDGGPCGTRTRNETRNAKRETRNAKRLAGRLPFRGDEDEDEDEEDEPCPCPL